MSLIPAGTILHHGSHEIIRFPKVQKPKPGVTTDFGNGVYFTLTFKRAREWAKKKANQNNRAYGYITSFRLKQDIVPSAKVKIFDGGAFPISHKGVVLCCVHFSQASKHFKKFSPKRPTPF